MSGAATYGPWHFSFALNDLFTPLVKTAVSRRPPGEKIKNPMAEATFFDSLRLSKSRGQSNA
jgi:hypothetical protein